jgi:hypothetical protein
MSALKPASLTSALLTRKGYAAPAGVAERDKLRRGNALEAPRWRPAPEPAPVVRIAAPTPVAKPRRLNRDSRSRVSLRLEEDRHLRLRLTAAHKNTTMQEVMMLALDSYLVECKQVLMGGSCACLEGNAVRSQCVSGDAKKE